MRFHALLGIAIAVVAVALAADTAQAFHRHHYNPCPCYPCAPVWTQFGCWGGHVSHWERKAWFKAAYGCGHKHWCGGWSAGCASGCSTGCATGCGAGCYASSYVIADGCGTCGGAGCSSCSGGAYIYGSDSVGVSSGCANCQVSSGDSYISEPTPAVIEGGIPSPTIIESAPLDSEAPPAPPVEAVPPADISPTKARQASFQPVSATNSKENGAAAFGQGLAAYRNGSFSQALQGFEAALRAEPNNALYHYHRALALFELSGAEVANDTLARAIQLESREPISGWGRQMERVQGRARAWVENARREAGLTR